MIVTIIVVCLCTPGYYLLTLNNPCYDLMFTFALSEAPTMRLAGLFLRRKAGREFHNYIQLLDYDPREYEVLLRRWPTEPFLQHLGAFSGPMIVGEDPQVTLLRESQSWSEKLAGKAGQTGARDHGLRGQKAVFLSVHGGRSQVDPVSHKPLELGVVLCYAIPITHSGESMRTP